MRRSILGILGLLLLGSRAVAQNPDPQLPPPDPEKHSGAPLGQFLVGSLVVTPTLRISSLAVDTNVQFQSRRKADFLAAAGPGLDLGLPFLDNWKLNLQGSSQYYYFLRTKELRRWTGAGTAALLWATTGTRVSLSSSIGRDFSRPSLEVDSRVASTQRNIAANFERDLGRLTLVADVTFNRNEVDSGQKYRGAELGVALTSDRISVRPEFRYKLTPFSSVLFEASFDDSRFPREGTRNYKEESAGAGLLTSGLLKGQVTAGVRRTRLSAGGPGSTQPYLRGDLSQQVGRRLRLREAYTQESSISAFAVAGSVPTFERRVLTIEVGVELTKRIDSRLSATQEKVRSDGLVSVVLDNGTVATARRDDVAYILHSDVGMRLGRARLAVFASFTTRESLYFSDLGIDGLQAGARVEYSPR